MFFFFLFLLWFVSNYIGWYKDTKSTVRKIFKNDPNEKVLLQDIRNTALTINLPVISVVVFYFIYTNL